MVFRWFLWVRQVVCVCVCVRERERERERFGLGFCVLHVFCVCVYLSFIHVVSISTSITMSEEKIYHVLIHISTLSHGSECMNMIHVIPPRKWKGERSIWNLSTFADYCLYHCIVSNICTEIDWCSQHIYVTMFCTNETGFRWVWHFLFLDLSV